MKKKSSGHKAGKPPTWIITGLLAAVAVAYVLFVFLPCQRTINQRQAEVQERRQQIMQAETLVRTVVQARERLAASRQVSNKWHADSPSRAELITHFASLSQQAQLAGMAIDRLDPLPAIDMNRISEQNVALQLHGTFSSIFDFVKRLEALPGTLWIQTLRLHAGSEIDPALRGELTLTIFVDRND